MITHHKDYLYSFDLNSLDNNKLFDNSLLVEKYLKNNIQNQINTHNITSSYTTTIFREYNLLTFPMKEFARLYREIVKYCTPLVDTSVQHYIQCWVNVFREGENIDWHGHWPKNLNVWHGFYCVNVGDSYTEYKIPNHGDIINVPSKNGRLVFGKSNGDKHRSSPWSDTKKPRITIAFDIAPETALLSQETFQPNHYVPLL